MIFPKIVVSSTVAMKLRSHDPHLMAEAIFEAIEEDRERIKKANAEEKIICQK